MSEIWPQKNAKGAKSRIELSEECFAKEARGAKANPFRAFATFAPFARTPEFSVSQCLCGKKKPSDCKSGLR